MQTLSDVERHALFASMYREYLQELIRHARSMVSNRELSEDLVQDVFVKMWLYLSRGGKIEKTRAFLHHVLKNAIVDLYRKHKTVSLDSLLEGGHEPSADDSGQLVDFLDGRSAFSLIEELPDKYRKVLRMKYGRNLSYEEIARSTGQSKNTTAVQVHRGLEKLKLLYKPA